MKKTKFLIILIFTTFLMSFLSCELLETDDPTTSTDGIPTTGFYIEDSVIFHFDTKLMWADETSFSTPEEATAYCEAYTLGDYDDWRVPTSEELGGFIKAIFADDEFDPQSYGTFDKCTAGLASDGYVKTPYGAEQYGGEAGDPINFSAGAALRCVRNFSDDEVPDGAKTNDGDDDKATDDNTLSADENSIVNHHNKIRAEVFSGNEIAWDTEVATLAQNYVEKLAAAYTNSNLSNGVSPHDPNNSTLGTGENIYWASWVPDTPLLDASKNWYAEKSYYNYDKNSCEAGQQCGHYTQQVWKTTTNIGCGKAESTTDLGGMWVVCKYTPAGNYTGQKPY